MCVSWLTPNTFGVVILWYQSIFEEFDASLGNSRIGESEFIECRGGMGFISLACYMWMVMVGVDYLFILQITDDIIETNLHMVK